MFCPECGAEFREGVEECNQCGVGLQANPPEEPVVERWVKVLETSELDVIPIIKSALEAAGIPIATKGEGLMRLFPAHTLGAPLHGSAGEVQLMVPPDRAEEARRLIEEGVEVAEDAGDGAAEVDAAEADAAP